MMKRKTTRRRKRAPKPPSARQLLEIVTRELQTLNRRYEGLFQFVSDPRIFDDSWPRREVVAHTLDRDMKAGETISVTMPIKFMLGKLS